MSADRQEASSAATERDLLATTDAQVWARAFVERFAGRMVSAGDVDEGLMLSWFANAIETGRTAGEAPSAARIPPGIKGVNVVQEKAVGGVPEPGGLPAAKTGLPPRVLNGLQHAESWRLVERYCERYPSDWRLVFRRGDEVLEVSVPEEVWRAFDA